MGVNRASFGIVDDDLVRQAARQELIRRYFRYNTEYLMGVERKETVERVRMLMEELGVKATDRKVVSVARDTALIQKKRGRAMTIYSAEQQSSFLTAGLLPAKTQS